MPTATEIVTTCAICEGRMDETDLELGRVGSQGPICGTCVAIVKVECECGTVGIRGVGRPSWFYVPWRTYIRDAWDGEFRRTVRVAHPNFPESESRWMARVRADAFAGWIAGFWNDDLRDPALWGMNENLMPERIHQTPHGAYLCDDCGAFCHDCDDFFPNDELEIDLCDGCRMPRCEECGENWEFQSDADACCGGSVRGVHDWNYRPPFRFWMTDADGHPYWREGGRDSWGAECAPTDALFIGIELETERGADAFPDFLANAGEDEDAPSFAYGKRDGSLSETGVELVTMPATLDAFRKRFPWDALAQWNADGARAFFMGTCGFHVHVSRSHFTPTHLWRFVAWQMRNQWFCERIAQRNNSQWARWQTLGEFRDNGKTLSDVVKGKANNGERYVAVNFQNVATVELRYFRGNLRPDAILTRVEFVDALAAFTREISASDVVAGALSVPNFAEFVRANIHRYATLAAWIADNETEWEDE